MAWAGGYAGQWAGQWYGATGTAPPSTLTGSASFTFAATGQATALASISGSASINLQAYALVAVAADRFNYGTVLRGPAGADNARLGRMALAARRRR